MCTVTLIPKGSSSFILTSNRDEAEERKTLPIQFYEQEGARVLYPKDAVAGGTWIGVSEQSHMVCLLNGGFENYKPQDNYRHSRGLVVQTLLAAKQLAPSMDDYNCAGLAPFTIVAASWQQELQFFEMVWDGATKHLRKLPMVPKIWSSATLYTPEMKSARQQWFADFCETQDQTQASLLEFHKNAGAGCEDYGLVMNRGALKTCSITQISKEEEHVRMRYEDLQKNKVDIVTFETVIV